MGSRKSFRDLVYSKDWSNFEGYLEKSDKIIEQDIKDSVERKRQLKKELLSDPNFKKRIKTPSKEDLEWAKNELFKSNVCAVDGTISNYNMATGTRCRIGVVATSYRNDRVERVIFISERKFAEESKTAMEHFSNLLKDHDMTNILLRAIMLFEERNIVLQRDEKWKFVHGPLIPFELRTGRFKKYKDALEVSLELAEELVEATNVIGVISSTRRLNLLNAGEVLDRFEYMDCGSLIAEWDDYLEKAHFKKEDEEMMKDFGDKSVSKIKIGLYKVGDKPYVFEAHKDVFDKAAALIIQDSSYQSLRGFPMLIDYADAICSKLLAAGDFRRKIEFKMAKVHPSVLGSEIEETRTRRR
ncbi:MAG: hypothetical protein ACFFBS_08060 [Promethearchaeota archaeon]